MALLACWRTLFGVRSPNRILVVASGSPRRRELLESLLGAVDAYAADVDETPRPGENAEKLVVRLAQAKAAVISDREPGRMVIGADTVVVIDGEILGKPVDQADARAMLRRLSGRSHHAVTGLAVTDGTVAATSAITTEVEFRSLSESDIDWYLASGEADDKAGAYGIQGLASLFVSRIDGSFQNVVGLPLADVDALLRSVGTALLDFDQRITLDRAG